MVTAKEKKEQASRLFEEAKAILASDKPSAEDAAKVEPILEDARRLMKEAGQLKEIEEAKNELLEHDDSKDAAYDERPRSFKSFGEFLVSVANAGNVKRRGPVDPRLEGLSFYDPTEPGNTKAHSEPGVQWQENKDRKATMIENVGARGGFLVPTEYRMDLQAVTPEDNPVRSRCTVIPMRRRQVNIPVLDQTGTTSGSPHWFGGMTASWTEESAAKSQSDPTFRQIELVAHKLVCYTRASDELLDDSAVGLDAFLRGPMGFIGAINWHEEYAFLRGTGAGQPLGVINANATITVNATASPPAPASIYNDLVNMLENFLPTGRGTWFINQRHLSDLMTASGPAGNASYLWGGMVAGPANTLLGFPYVLTEKLPGPGTSGSILLADFRYYLIGDRQAVTIDSTNVERFQYDETSWRAVHRVDGQPWLSTYLTLADGTATVSPFVILGAKST